MKETDQREGEDGGQHCAAGGPQAAAVTVAVRSIVAKPRRAVQSKQRGCQAPPRHVSAGKRCQAAGQRPASIRLHDGVHRAWSVRPYMAAASGGQGSNWCAWLQQITATSSAWQDGIGRIVRT